MVSLFDFNRTVGVRNGVYSQPVFRRVDKLRKRVQEGFLVLGSAHILFLDGN